MTHLRQSFLFSLDETGDVREVESTASAMMRRENGWVVRLLVAGAGNMRAERGHDLCIIGSRNIARGELSVD